MTKAFVLLAGIVLTIAMVIVACVVHSLVQYKRSLDDR